MNECTTDDHDIIKERMTKLHGGIHGDSDEYKEIRKLAARSLIQLGLDRQKKAQKKA